MPQRAASGIWPIREQTFYRDFARACLSALTLALAEPASGEIDSRIDEFLASVNKSIAELAGQPEAKASTICHRVVSSLLNMDAIARSVLASSNFSMSPQQHTAYHAAAVHWAVRDCVTRNRDNRGMPLELVGIRPDDTGERIVVTRSTQPAHTTFWRLRGARRLQAVDVVIDGRSMILALRDETNALRERNGGNIDEMIDALGR